MLLAEDQQPAAKGVFARKQRRDQPQTDCIQQQVLPGAVDQVAGDQPPVLAMQDRRTLIAEQLSPGIAGQSEQNQDGTQQSNEPGSLDRRHGCRGAETPGDGVTHAFNLLCYDPRASA